MLHAIADAAPQVCAIGTSVIASVAPHRNTFEIYATICHLPFGARRFTV
jgi:hypothetical protein